MNSTDRPRSTISPPSGPCSKGSVRARPPLGWLLVPAAEAQQGLDDQVQNPYKVTHMAQTEKTSITIIGTSVYTTGRPSL